MKELNEFGLRVWKHKHDKNMFLEKAYSWKDNVTLMDETDGRLVVDQFKYSTFDFEAWVPMTQEEYNSVKSKYKEIYEKKN